MFWLESGLPNISTRNVVYICRPKMSHMRTIAGHIRASQSTPSSAGPLAFTILLVPRVTELCRKVLEDEGVAGDVTVSEARQTSPQGPDIRANKVQFKLEFVPLEDDLLSLETVDVARDLYLVCDGGVNVNCMETS